MGVGQVYTSGLFGLAASVCISTNNECGKGNRSALLSFARLTWLERRENNDTNGDGDQDKYEDQIRSDQKPRYVDASCSGSVSDLSSFAHRALSGAPRCFLVPSLRTAPTNTRARPAPRLRHHNLHRVHLSRGPRLAPARVGRRRWRRRLVSGRRRSTPWFGIRA
jgi:hypothetical protein